MIPAGPHEIEPGAAVISEKGDKVFLQLHEPITTYLLPFLTVEMYLQVILDIKKTDHGLVISRQEVILPAV